MLAPYFTVLIPWVAPEFATIWHPDEPTGPFSTLTRGAFATEDNAIRWARDHLAGSPYSVKRIDPEPELEG